MKVQDRVHYLRHPLADIWTGVTIVDDEQLAVIDSATQAAVNETVLPYLEAAGLHHGQPVVVVNTHCHCDHIGGNAGLREALNATIVAHDLDAAFVADRASQFDALFGPFRDFGELAVNPAGFHQLAGADAPVDRRLKDGERLRLGALEFHVLHTPGHTAGSVVLYEPSRGLALAGDSIQGEGTSDTQVPMIVDMAAYRQSMARLAELDVRLLIADHPFKPHPDAFFTGEAAREFIRHSASAAEAHAEQVDGLLRAAGGPLTLLDLARRLATALSLTAPNPYVAILAAACADELTRAGRAVRLAGRGWHPASIFAAR